MQAARLSRRSLLAGSLGCFFGGRAFGRALEDNADYSESVYADAVSADGRHGFIVRLARYPQLGQSRLWCHGFSGDDVFAFTDHDAPCGEAVTDLASGLAKYGGSADRLPARLERVGVRLRPSRCRIEAQVNAHGAAHPDHGPGTVSMHVDATFVPGHAPVSSLAGRSEVLGAVEGTLRLGEKTLRLQAPGHFHEQVRDTPRWQAPFCYATIRGANLYSVAIKLEQGAVGFVVRDGETSRVTDFEIEAPSSERAGRRALLVLESGERVSCRYRDTHVYSVPIDDLRRRGSLVVGTMSDVAVSGCINDYLPERLSYLS
ncbi:MAG: hypothetical protein AAGK22_22075 [Acidobacteriota bacterium]